MTNEQWERIRDELEVIKNTAEYGVDCVDDENELKEILIDIKRSRDTILHILNEQ